MLISVPMTLFIHVRAVNTAPDSENKIHDDRVAAEYGFQGGLVPGVTVYGYMASAVIERSGLEWLHRGAMDVRFFQPFYAGEEVAISIADLAEGRIKVEAGSRASATAWIDDSDLSTEYPAEYCTPKEIPSRETIQPGKALGTLEKTLDLSQPGLSAPFDAFIGPERFAHPAIILGLANELLMHNYSLGPWIHSSSEVRNVNPAIDGERLQVRGKIAEVYERKGHEFVVLDVAILSADRLISRIRHTAIWQPREI
jgi:acyl dehydratase